MSERPSSGLPGRLFRAHVLRRANDRTVARDAGAAAYHACDAEVGENGRAVFAKQNVLGFDVAVHEALRVGVVEAACDVFDHRDRRLHVQAALQAPVQVAAAQIFHDEVVALIVHAGVVNLHDVRMTQLRDDARLAHESFAEARVRRVLGRHDLDRNEAAELLLHREIDARHTAATDLALYAVARNLETRFSHWIEADVLRLPPDDRARCVLRARRVFRRGSPQGRARARVR